MSGILERIKLVLKNGLTGLSIELDKIFSMLSTYQWKPSIITALQL
jgi:hypothetical protein